MACIEHRCVTSNCMFQEFSNEILKKCPLCGDKVLNLFDEYPEDNESPNGDDYNDIAVEDD